MQRKLASPHARRVISAVLSAAAAWTGATARAEAPHPPIVLVLDPCAAVDAREVRRLVPIEMGAPLAPGGETDTTRVFVGCVPGSPQLVRLEVRDAVTGRHVDRVITLVGDSKTDQARLVAIVAVELVATSRSELRERAASFSPPPGDPAAPAAIVVTAAPAQAPAAPLWRALVFGSVRHVADLPSLLPGGGLALERTVARHFVLGADAAAEGSGQPTALGDVAAFVASASAFAGVRFERGAWAVQAGGGARGGVARFAGEARRGSAVQVTSGVFSAPWVGALFESRATATIGRGVVLLVGGELGYVTSPALGYVAGHDAVAMRGLWWSAALGVGHAL
ncbi:MAG TPA: hypothetical protein VHK47_11150 [Polyangia bacterium]|jgi:hypothetical protein|nr:hypothetical protein [Polyangia bacterium]